MDPSNSGSPYEICDRGVREFWKDKGFGSSHCCVKALVARDIHLAPKAS